MIVCTRDKQRCWILDPTVQYEHNDAQVDAAVADKRRKYVALCPCLWNIRGFSDVTVAGLFFDARGMLLHRTMDFLV